MEQSNNETKEGVTQPPLENSTSHDVSLNPPLVSDEIKELLNKMETQKAELKTLIAKNEELIKTQLINGRALAGNVPVQKTKEQIEKEEAMKLLEGTGLNPFK